jgi:hypothetical protein
MNPRFRFECFLERDTLKILLEIGWHISTPCPLDQPAWSALAPILHLKNISRTHTTAHHRLIYTVHREARPVSMLFTSIPISPVISFLAI